MLRFIGNLDLCGQQVRKPCRTSMGFPVVLPHAESDEAAGFYFLLHLYFLFRSLKAFGTSLSCTEWILLFSPLFSVENLICC